MFLSRTDLRLSYGGRASVNLPYPDTVLVRAGDVHCEDLLVSLVESLSGDQLDPITAVGHLVTVQGGADLQTELCHGETNLSILTVSEAVSALSGLLEMMSMLGVLSAVTSTVMVKVQPLMTTLSLHPPLLTS